MLYSTVDPRALPVGEFFLYPVQGRYINSPYIPYKPGLRESVSNDIYEAVYPNMDRPVAE